ncbi:MAG: hypothetical protein ACXVYY_13945 [Oryzihumus sp.]
MTTSQTPTAPDLPVLAGVVSREDPVAVARVAAQEAARRGCGLRFVQVVPPGTTPEERAEADELTFDAALRALHGRSRVSFTFETVAGDPASVLVDRSGAASLLVVGADVPHGGPAVARWCREHAACEVLTVGGEPGT